MQSESAHQIELTEKEYAEAKFKVAAVSANIEIEKVNMKKAELDFRRAGK